MTILHSKYVSGPYRVPAAECAGEVVAVRYEYDVPASVTLDDIIELGILPQYHRVVDMILDVDDLDSNASPTIKLDVGLMNGDVGEDTSDGVTARTCGAEFFSQVTTAQGGGVVRPTLATAFRVAPTDKNRSIGVKIQTAAATPQAGKLGLTVYMGT